MDVIESAEISSTPSTRSSGCRGSSTRRDAAEQVGADAREIERGSDRAPDRAVIYSNLLRLPAARSRDDAPAR
jgi:hypothetical protein